MKKLIILSVVFISCSPLKKYNRQIRSLDRYIERNEKKQFKKEQRQLKREFKQQQLCH